MLDSMGLKTGIDLEKLLKVRDIVKAAVPDEMYGFTPEAGVPKGYVQTSKGGRGWGVGETKLAAE